MLRNLIYFILFLLCIGFVSAALTDGLISYYECDEISGTSLTDLHGSNDGTANHEKVFTSEEPGIINTGVDFTQSTDDWVDVDGLTSSAKSYSIQIWADVQTTPDFSFFDTQTGRLFFGYGVSNQLIQFWDGGDFQDFEIDLSVGMTQYVITIDDVSKDVLLYVDGSQVGNTLVYIGNLDIGGNIGIGQIYTGSGFPADGVFDEIGIWGKVLTPTEISLLYAGGSGLAYPFVSDTCSCPGLNQNWEISMSDYCDIIAACDLGTGTLSFINAGWVGCSAAIDTTNMGDPGTGGIMYINNSCVITIN